MQPHRNLSLKVVKVQSLEDDLNDLHHADKLTLNLVRTAENMCVILCEATYTGQSVKLTALLITVYGTELSYTQRKVPV